MPLAKFPPPIRASQQAGSRPVAEAGPENEGVVRLDRQLLRIDDRQRVEGVALERELHAVEREPVEPPPPFGEE